jgi:hypothetical protein
MYNTPLQPFSTGFRERSGPLCVHASRYTYLAAHGPRLGRRRLGTWKVNPDPSRFPPDTRAKNITIRIGSHAKGEVFTMDRIEADGRTTTSNTILYLDDHPREFQDLGCSGTQSSHRVDSRTVEILRTCGSAGWIRFVRRMSTQPNELVLEVTEQQAGGHRIERRFVFKKQSGVGTTREQ